MYISLIQFLYLFTNDIKFIKQVMCEKIKSYLHKCFNLLIYVYYYIIRIFIFFTELLDIYMC
jgi:hypothetical protein